MSVDAVRNLCGKDGLSSTDPSTRRFASATLKVIAFDDDFEALREAEAIPAIVMALRAGAASPITQNCADAVWSLSADSSNHAAILRAGAIPLLAQLLFASEVNHSAVATICNIVDTETGMPHEVGIELVASGGVEALVDLLPEVGAPVSEPSETQHLAVQALAALSVNQDVGVHISRSPQGIPKLIELVKNAGSYGGARSQIARHAAAALARVATNQPMHQAQIREAGGIAPLIDLLADSLDKWAATEGDMQAAQHAAGALWVLAGEKESKDLINDHPDARRLLACLVGGKLGKKAEGNAAGALLLLGTPFPTYTWDPVSVVTMSVMPACR